MTPSLAFLLWIVLLLGLLLLDPAKEPRTSMAVWVPVIWMFIVASRLPSQWLGGQTGLSATALEEGNPLDRAVWTALIVLAIGILVSRSFKWGEFLARNLALTAFLGLALVSILWSDFPDIAFKRWFRDLGNYLVILVPLSDSRPLEAVRAVLRRLSYLLIPLSVLLVKYYPGIGRSFDPWTGAGFYSGVTTTKNMLGVVCLLSGLFFFWDTVTRWSARRDGRTKRIILVNLIFFAMTLWLLNLANSATSRTCLILGCLVIAAAHTKSSQRHPAVLKTLVPASVLLYLTLVFGLGLNGQLAEAVGRNGNLTDRTLIWSLLLSMHTNPLLGVGYQSFWLGPRLDYIWKSFLGLNEAHDGYLGIYLELGIVGLGFLVAFLVSTYRTICRRLEPLSPMGSLGLGLWIILVFYNVTEAAFEGGLLWMTLLLGALVLPPLAPVKAPELDFPALEEAGVSERFAHRL